MKLTNDELVATDDKLVVFLYLLIRDHLPFGSVMEIIQHIKTEAMYYDLTNSEIAKWAERVAGELR